MLAKGQGIGVKFYDLSPDYVSRFRTLKVQLFGLLIELLISGLGCRRQLP